MPKLYSVYQKMYREDGSSHWVGTHRLPISVALRRAELIRANGFRVVFRLANEPAPSFKD
jgi:hypothetical protein